MQQIDIEAAQDVKDALSPTVDYDSSEYVYEDDDTVNLPILSPGEVDNDEVCYSAPDVVAAINNSEYSLSMFYDALYTTGIVGKSIWPICGLFSLYTAHAYGSFVSMSQALNESRQSWQAHCQWTERPVDTWLCRPTTGSHTGSHSVCTNKRCL